MPTHRSSAEVVARIDGASRGNPGPAAYAVVMETADGASLEALSKFIGQATNNVAEYESLLAALEYALSHHHLRLRVVSDSELLTRQIEGTYKVKNASLKPLHERARQLISQLESFSIEHVPREQNRKADRLANQALDMASRRGSAAPEPRPRLRTTATYQSGVLRPHTGLPLRDGETVELEIRRKP